jgi:hypothetical protein
MTTLNVTANNAVANDNLNDQDNDNQQADNGTDTRGYRNDDENNRQRQ